MTRYATYDDYLERCPGGPLEVCQADKWLMAAQRDVDTLTYNRITAGGWDSLTPYQQDLVRQAVCEQAEFAAEYGELLSNPLASYGINGVSMSWDSGKLLQLRGVYTRPAIYALLQQTGLTYRGVV